MLDIFKTFTEINKCFSPSGNEAEIRKAIEKIAKPYADDIKTDTLGNLIVHKKGPGKKLMLAAHMDSIGLIATHIEKCGRIRVAAVGGVSPLNIIAAPVRFRNGTVGTVQANQDADKAKLTMNDMFVDIGVKDEKEAEKYVKPGDICIYDTPTYLTAGGEIVSPYTDNRSCCVAQLLALSLVKEPQYELYFVFTVQEEVGLRGAKPGAFSVDPDYAIACDVTPADNVPGSKHGGNSETGKGAAIKIMDVSVVCDPAVTGQLEKLAKKNKIAYQRDVITVGGTDAGAIHVSRAGVKTGGISVPCKYVHSPQEMVAVSDIEATGKLMAAFCESKM